MADTEDDTKETFIPNIFYKRKTADYMHYMKFEAFNWVLHSSFMSLDVLMIYVHFQMVDADYGVAPNAFLYALFVMIATHLMVLIVFSYQLANEHRKEDRFKILPKLVTGWQYALLALALCGYIFTSYVYYSYDHKEKYILVGWVMVEAVSFPFIILYMLLQRYYLKKNLTEKQDEAILRKGEGMEMEAMGDNSTKVSAQEGLINKDDDKDDQRELDPLNDSMADESLEKKLVAMHDKANLTQPFPVD